MIKPSVRIVRHRLRMQDLDASLYASFKDPLKKLGFRARHTALAFRTGQMLPLGAYVFTHPDGRRLFLYFSRWRPFSFVIRQGNQRYCSPFYTTFPELEKGFCQYFKIKSFLPATMRVVSWPLRETA